MNSDHSYTASNFLRQLPRVLAEDARMYALATAIANALAVRLTELREAEIYPRLDELPERLLDLLAADFAVDWWDSTWSREHKVQSLKESWRVHRLLGTPAAVEMAVQAAFGSGEVEEWTEYGGEPNHFRITGMHMAVTGAALTRFRRLLDLVKRESSALDRIIVRSEHSGTLHPGIYMLEERTITVDCDEPV